jgi:transcriptional regulator with XRE-family HTH domain
MLIRELRRKKCISQEQLAAMCGLSLRTIQRVEGGHRIGYTSLHALATVFKINVDTLEQELYTMEKSSSAYKDLPLWIRLYIGSSWYAASRKEFQKFEFFCIFLTITFAITWAFLSMSDSEKLSVKISIFGFICTLIGAYNISITIRVGDKYDIWSRLEPTLQSGIFDFIKLLVFTIIISAVIAPLIFILLF